MGQLAIERHGLVGVHSKCKGPEELQLFGRRVWWGVVMLRSSTVARVGSSQAGLGFYPVSLMVIDNF